MNKIAFCKYINIPQVTSLTFMHKIDENNTRIEFKYFNNVRLQKSSFGQQEENKNNFKESFNQPVAEK